MLTVKVKDMKRFNKFKRFIKQKKIFASFIIWSNGKNHVIATFNKFPNDIISRMFSWVDNDLGYFFWKNTSNEWKNLN